MQPPVPIEALLQQAVWIDWHDEQLHWDRTCDSCGQDLQPAEVRRNAVITVAPSSRGYCAQLCLLFEVRVLQKVTGACSLCIC
jgi:hypothetical protein